MSNWSFYNAVQAAKRRIIAAGYADRMAAKPNAERICSAHPECELSDDHAGPHLYIVGEQGPEMFTPDPPDA